MVVDVLHVVAAIMVRMSVIAIAVSGLVACGDSAGTFTLGDAAPPAAHAMGDSWLNPASADFHGEADSGLTCADCHNLKTDCSTCHFGATGSKVPAGVSWSHGATPHDYPGQASVCNECHGLMRGLGDAPAACHDCHGQDD